MNRCATFSWLPLVLLWVWLKADPVRAQSAAALTGRVLDENAQPLPGANVLLKTDGPGTAKTGTTTDANGQFRINIPASASAVVVSSVGYTTQEVVLQNRSDLTITMVPGDKTLNEVVVVGYGTQQKKDLTGAISSISAKELTKLPVSGVDQALQGQVAGLQISNTSGAPGGNTSILVRGVGSISGGVEPLFVVDGFPVNSTGVGNPLNSLNPQDIESIDVLKDASSTAIYGSRGSNGVIIITTKRGKAGKARVELDYYTGFQQAAKLLDMMNSKQFAEFTIEGRNNGYLDNGGTDPNAPNSARAVSYRIPDVLRDPANLERTTDWQREIFRTAPIRNVQVSTSGGTETTRYSASAGYFNQQGILINTGFKRYSASLSVDAKLAKRVNVGLSLLPSYSQLREVPSTGHYGDLNVIASAWAMPPTTPVYNPDGSYGNTIPAVDGNVGIQNPIKIANEIQQNGSQLRLLGNAFLEYQIIDGLKFRTSFGTDFNNSRYNYWKPSTLDAANPSSPAVAYQQQGEDINWLNENTLTYSRTAGVHQINAVVGYTAQKSTNNFLRANATNFPDDLVPTVSGGQINGGAGTVSEWSLLSYLARATYAFRDKYLVTATIRSDGSSRFGANNKWGTFPSASVGWRVSEEPFMRTVSFVSDLKLRASYGLSGNNAIGNYRFVGLLGPSNYVTGNSYVPGLAQSTLTNNDLGWETSKQLDLGIDLSLFNNRLLLTADYYDRRNTDMLLNVSVPAATGYTNAFTNIGELQNKGIELTLNTRNVVGRFQWSTNLNFTANKNKVLRLGSEGERIFDGAGRGNTNVTQVGSPIGSFYGHVFDGVFLNQEQITQHATQTGAVPGDIRFRDLDGNKIINDNDRDIIGSPLPKFYYGITNTFSYKNLSLSVLLSGQGGNQVFWATGVLVYNFAGVQNNVADVYDNAFRSTQNPGDGLSPRIIRGGRNNNFRFSSFYLRDGDYLRIRNVSLNYTLPTTLTNKVGLGNARLYANASNLFTFTKYPGLDPEISNSGDNIRAAGIDYGGYPVARTITFGINLSF